MGNGRETIVEATFFKGEGGNDRQTTVGSHSQVVKVSETSVESLLSRSEKTIMRAHFE